MATRIIVLRYDPKTADDGGPIDLFSYLLNEFENRKMNVRITEPGARSRLAEAIKEAMKGHLGA